MPPVKVFFPFLLPTEFNAPDSTAVSTFVVAEGQVDGARIGNNSIMFFPGTATASKIWWKDDSGWIERDTDALPFEVDYFTRQQRDARQATRMSIAGLLPSAAAATMDDYFPLIAIATDGMISKLYHFADINQRGSIFVKYAEVAYATATPEDVLRSIADSAAKLSVARRSVNDACNHGRWRQEMELERKFTFFDIPDTWRLINTLYSHVIEGGFKGFVPEVGLEFQAFDYIVDIFDVLEPENQKGYIAFIPQVNGKTCVKQKWFAENTELRRETLSFNEDLTKENFEARARALCGGTVQRLPSYRRKRFDVNFESLETGNVYGVFFDICRTVDAAVPNAFSQCEVEYCRSRTFGELTQVLEQYEEVCALVEGFLANQGIHYTKEIYSKLDFGRETLALQNQKSSRVGQ